MDLRVAIIGAGLGGIAMAVNLDRVGVSSFRVFERAAGPGGVWWHNTYPGCEVDVPSQAYSYSFMRYRWSSSHASRDELQRYVEVVLDRYGLRERCTFGNGVQRVEWDDTTETYTVTTDDGARHEFDVVVSCLGMLSQPNVPAWAHDTPFGGPLFHTSQYRHDVDLADRRVAVVGTGSTACQLAPALAPIVGRLDLYQREPGWVMPKKVRPFTAAERRRYERFPISERLDRYRLFRQAAGARRAFDSRDPEQAKLRTYAEKYIAGVVEDPEVQQLLTPDYPYGCKRPVFASGFYRMFNRPNVHLVPTAVRELTATGIVDEAGIERPADVVILATGFQATRYQGSLEVVGRGGQRLHDAWGADPVAFLGMTVPGFPNFFMLYGPNTNGGWSIISTLERQAEAIARALRRMRRRRITVIDTRPAVLSRYDGWIQRRLAVKADVAEAGCNNYYHSASGKNVTQMPLDALQFYVATKLLPPLGWRGERGTRPRA